MQDKRKACTSFRRVRTSKCDEEEGKERERERTTTLLLSYGIIILVGMSEAEFGWNGCAVCARNSGTARGAKNLVVMNHLRVYKEGCLLFVVSLFLSL